MGHSGLGAERGDVLRALARAAELGFDGIVAPSVAIAGSNMVVLPAGFGKMARRGDPPPD